MGEDKEMDFDLDEDHKAMLCTVSETFMKKVKILIVLFSLRSTLFDIWSAECLCAFLSSFRSDTSYVDFSWSGDLNICLKDDPQLE